MKCGIIGCGRLGRALAVALTNSGIDLVLLVDNNRKLLFTMQRMFPKVKLTWQLSDWPPMDILFITVNDDEINPVAKEIFESAIDLSGVIAVHTSGALSSTELSPLKEKGALLASMHPVQTFSGTSKDAMSIRKCYFALEGETKALPVMKTLIEKMGANWFELKPEHKSNHHLACILASNYVIALMKMATDLLEPIGLSRSEAKKILLPLMSSAVENISNQSLAMALTGPVARGDAKTVLHHINLLKKQHPGLIELYTSLARTALELAKELPDAKLPDLEKIEGLLEKAGKPK